MTPHPPTGGGSGSKRRVVLLSAATVLVVVAAVVAWIDQRVRSDEDRALAACSERAEAAAIRADQVLGSMAEYIRPSLAERSGLWALMSEAAQDAQPPIETALATCRDVDVLGLHRAHVRERAAYVDYLVARSDQLAAIRADGRAAGEADPTLARLREEAFGDRP